MQSFSSGKRLPLGLQLRIWRKNVRPSIYVTKQVSSSTSFAYSALERVMYLIYLFCLGTGDSEILRLLTEIDREVHLLTSYTIRSPRRTRAVSKQHDIDTEMALQPLRSENCDLRR